MVPLSLPPRKWPSQQLVLLAQVLLSSGLIAPPSAGAQNTPTSQPRALGSADHHSAPLAKELVELQQGSANLAERSAALEKATAGLEAQAFAATTTLKGEASFILGGVPGYGRKGAPNSQGGSHTTLNDELRLNLYTSFSGKDLLRVRWGAGNFSSYPFGTSTSNIFKLIHTENGNDQVFLDRLYYQFPIGKNDQYKVSIGALIRNNEITWIPSVYRSDVLDYFSTGGGSGVYNKALGEGIGISWKQPVPAGKPALIANLNVIVSGSAVNSDSSSCSAGCNNGASGADSSYGIDNAGSGINALAQLGYQGENWGLALGYRHGTTQTAVRSANGVAGTPLADGQQDNSVAINAYWHPRHSGWIPSISSGFGYNLVSGSSTAPGPQSSRSWMVGIQWNSPWKTSDAAGVAIGQPGNAAGATGSSPWLIEGFYRYQISNNLSFTPALFYGSGVSTSNANDGGQPIFNGLGGVIQTTFSF